MSLALVPAIPDIPAFPLSAKSSSTCSDVLYKSLAQTQHATASELLNVDAD